MTIFAPAKFGPGATLGAISRAEDSLWYFYKEGTAESEDVEQRIHHFMGLLCEDRIAGPIMAEMGIQITSNEAGLLTFRATRKSKLSRGQRAVRFVRQPYIRALFESCGLAMYGVHSECTRDGGQALKEE